MQLELKQGWARPLCPRGQRLAGTLRFAYPTQHVTNNVSTLLQQDMLAGWRLIEGFSPNGW